MNRRTIIAALGWAAAVPRSAIAQTSGSTKIPRIGVLWHGGSAEEEGAYIAAIRSGLSSAGYVEGKTIVLEQRFAAESAERFASHANELVAARVDVLVAITRLGALAAQRATTAIPIVFVYVPDPLGSRLVASLARPGGNITGLSNFADDLAAKRVEYLKLVVPGLSRLALLVNPGDSENARYFIRESLAAGERLQVKIHPVEITQGDQLGPAFARMRADGMDGVAVSQDPVFYVNRNAIADLALDRGLPAIVYSREAAEAGALVSYGPSIRGMFYRTAAYIDRILKGAKPADLPVEQPTRFEFIINMKAARRLGIEVPSAVFARADAVIE